MADADVILEKVSRSLEILIDAAAPYGGLFPSLLDRRSHTMLEKLPAPIPGQRTGDRAHLGSNLIHDQAALKTLYALGQTLDRPGYTTAADAYLRRFARHCTATATGLFPWGEHAFWHLRDDKIGDSRLLNDPSAPNRAIHDHLRQVPLWLWRKLDQYHPQCVQDFADGLEFHFVEGSPREYIRHAHIEVAEHLVRGSRSCDFPRHSGFYIFDWAFAWSRSRRPALLARLEEMVDYWWPRRDRLDLLQIESRTPANDSYFYQTNAPGQTLSLAASLLEAAPLLEPKGTALAAVLKERALHYINGFLAAPHDLNAGVFVILCRRGSNDLVEQMPVWGSVYGVWPASYPALTALCAYRLTGDARLLDWAAAVGRCYIGAAFPDRVQVPAMDAGLGLGLVADLYDITGQDHWLQAGLELAQRLTDIYFDGELPRGAAGIDWYESQMGPSFLQHGLARISLLARDRKACPLAADYTAR